MSGVKLARIGTVLGGGVSIPSTLGSVMPRATGNGFADRPSWAPTDGICGVCGEPARIEYYQSTVDGLTSMRRVVRCQGEKRPVKGCKWVQRVNCCPTITEPVESEEAMPKMSKEWGDDIKARAKDAGLTLKDVAERTGLSLVAVKNGVNGYSALSPAAASKIEAAVKIETPEVVRVQATPEEQAALATALMHGPDDKMVTIFVNGAKLGDAPDGKPVESLTYGWACGHCCEKVHGPGHVCATRRCPFGAGDTVECIEFSGTGTVLAVHGAPDDEAHTHVIEVQWASSSATFRYLWPLYGGLRHAAQEQPLDLGPNFGKVNGAPFGVDVAMQAMEARMAILEAKVLAGWEEFEELKAGAASAEWAANADARIKTLKAYLDKLLAAHLEERFETAHESFTQRIGALERLRVDLRKEVADHVTQALGWTREDGRQARLHSELVETVGKLAYRLEQAEKRILAGNMGGAGVLSEVMERMATIEENGEAVKSETNSEIHRINAQILAIRIDATDRLQAIEDKHEALNDGCTLRIGNLEHWARTVPKEVESLRSELRSIGLNQVEEEIGNIVQGVQEVRERINLQGKAIDGWANRIEQAEEELEGQTKTLNDWASESGSAIDTMARRIAAGERDIRNLGDRVDTAFEDLSTRTEEATSETLRTRNAIEAYRTDAHNRLTVAEAETNSLAKAIDHCELHLEQMGATDGALATMAEKLAELTERVDLLRYQAKPDKPLSERFPERIGLSTLFGILVRLSESQLKSMFVAADSYRRMAESLPEAS